MESPLISIARCCGDSTLWHQCFGLGKLMCELVLLAPLGVYLQLRYSSQSQLPHMSVGSAHFASLPSYQSRLLYILHCNFDVVIGGGKHSVYLLCHLDWKPIKEFLKSFWPV